MLIMFVMVKLKKARKKKKKENSIDRHITITQSQEEWARKNCVNLSWVLQSKLEELMSK